jgi:squalene cyclase
MQARRLIAGLACLAGVLLGAASLAGAAEPAGDSASPPKAPAEGAAADIAARCKAATDRGVEYLIKQQAPDGSWGKGSAGITALCA